MPADPFAELLVRLRKKAGRTQEEQVEAINAASGRDTMTRREISRYENGRNIPTNHTVAHIATACGLRPEQIQREAAAAHARRRKGGRRDGEDLDDMNRRTLIGGAALGMAAAAEPWGRLAHALKRGAKLDSAGVEALTDHAADRHAPGTAHRERCRGRADSGRTTAGGPPLVAVGALPYPHPHNNLHHSRARSSSRPSMTNSAPCGPPSRRQVTMGQTLADAALGPLGGIVQFREPGDFDALLRPTGLTWRGRHRPNATTDGPRPGIETKLWLPC
ncbi:helix-turn-helix domain-containing protein [Streptomyces sp. NPDC015532]|uniref:helix-turn-helix domain-containing protein n=1 Tax=Streptomyces sp. NPDC015532 TaxID=3364960 RepID=UPI00370034AF